MVCFKGILYCKSRGARKRGWKVRLGETRDCGAPWTLPSGAGPAGLGTGQPRKGPGHEGRRALGLPWECGWVLPSPLSLGLSQSTRRIWGAVSVASRALPLAKSAFLTTQRCLCCFVRPCPMIYTVLSVEFSRPEYCSG